MIKGLIFDKDGTLFHFGDSWNGWAGDTIENLAKGDASVVAKMAGAISYDLKKQVLLPNSPVIAATLAEVAALLLPYVSDTNLADLSHQLDETAANAPMVPAVPLLPFMDQLAVRGMITGVATNDSYAAASAHLTMAGVFDRFDFVAGYDSGHGGKPAPGMLLAFCAATGLAPEQVAMVGDSTHDLGAGRAAGMTTIGVLTGPADRQTLAPLADVIFDTIAGIPNWLDQQA